MATLVYFQFVFAAITAVPLNTDIAKFAEHKLEQPKRFQLKSVSSEGTALPDISVETDKFARGQFQLLSDQDKLSRPSFEDMPAGFSIASHAARAGNAIPATMTRLMCRPSRNLA